ncbi:1,6-anhydro-N-acetylmuramyl-L-alanine amidase AmpD [Pseudohaliea rubra]|nr:1,6-anhydro-N-acetylmuramyl-L-alanine amidase AmpD [Pseudohaliea rubra]
MAYTVTRGRVAEAVWCPSPNCNERPAGASPELIVLHNISLPPGEFGGGHVQALFCNRLDPAVHPFFEEVAGLCVSAHFLVDRRGRLTQFVSCDRRAWHAGISTWCGRDNCNDFSIGIELEGTDHTPYSDAQYAVLGGLVPALCSAYATLGAARITGHSDIAPGRKTDPGPAFDWERLSALLAGACA